MDLGAQIDAYCERVAPGLWAEPLNAATNAAFLLAALVMWHRLRGQRMPLARALAVTLAGIGVASGLWHTLALGWTGAADSLSILVFILIYLYAACRHFWSLSPALAAAGMLAFFPYAAAAGWAFAQLPFFAVSAAYWPVALLIGGSAAVLHASAPATARGLALGAALLALSITLRSLDAALCPAWPAGTHFLWHLLNALMLGWMIEVYRRHRLAAPAGRR